MPDVKNLTKEEAAQIMDYCLIYPQWPEKNFLEACENVKKYKFGGFYVTQSAVNMVVNEIGNFCTENEIKIGTGVAFPYGSSTTKTKLTETENLINNGCTVLDMVANIGALKDKKYDYYKNEVSKFVQICSDAGVESKVIIENGYLTDEEIITAVNLVAESGADYIKTATGQGIKGRPNIHDIELIINELNRIKSNCKLKVAGVIEPRIIDAYSFIQLGAEKIGSRAAVEIVEGLELVQKLMFKY